MAITAFKTFAAFEVLTASDLNASFSQIINNPIDLWSPMTKNAAAGGFKFTGLGVSGAVGEALTYGAEAFVIGTTSAGTLTINGTAVSVPNGLNFDSNTLVIDAANNIVNVGTTSNPNLHKLLVVGDIAAFTSNNAAGTTALRLVSSASLPQGGVVISGTKTAAGDAIFAVATTSGGSGGTRLTINETGAITPGTNNAQTLGTAALQWSDFRTVLMTATGAAAFNGAVTLGDAAADTITFTGTPAGLVLGAAYTPTLTNTGNITASTLRTAFYFRIGAYVVAFVNVNIDPNVGSTGSVLEISLPVASNFANTYDCIGGGTTDVGGVIGLVLASVASDRAVFSWICDSVPTTRDYGIWFAYPII